MKNYITNKQQKKKTSDKFEIIFIKHTYTVFVLTADMFQYMQWSCYNGLSILAG